MSFFTLVQASTFPSLYIFKPLQSVPPSLISKPHRLQELSLETTLTRVQWKRDLETWVDQQLFEAGYFENAKQANLRTMTPDERLQVVSNILGEWNEKIGNHYDAFRRHADRCQDIIERT